MKNIKSFLSEKFRFLEVKLLSIYLNRRVFVIHHNYTIENRYGTLSIDDNLHFTFLSTVCKSYQDGEKGIMKDSVQRSTIQS